MTKFYESSLSGVNPSELLRLCPAAEAEAQQERGSNPETQGNFFRVCSFNVAFTEMIYKTAGGRLRDLADYFLTQQVEFTQPMVKFHNYF